MSKKKTGTTQGAAPTTNRERRPSVLITDLDNTLYDWVEMWSATFGALLRGIVETSGLPQEELEREIRMIHQKYGTSEYSFVIQEIPSLRAKYPGQDLALVFAGAISAAGEARRRSLRLYPGVKEALVTLRQMGVLIVAYTESRAFYTNRRVRRLDLDGVIDVLYSPPDHELPDEIDALRTHDRSYYGLSVTKERHLPEGDQKPDPEVLLDIIRQTCAGREQCIYVGDSLMKDVAMAQEAGVIDVHAAYGAAQNRPEYELLRRVSHWPQTVVEQEKVVQARPHITPSFVLRESFAELLRLFEFQRFVRH